MTDARAAMIDAVLLYGIESGTYDKYPDAMVDAILRHLAENGLAVVPKEPTRDMIDRAVESADDDFHFGPYEARECWNAMLSAPPLKEND